MDVLGWFAGESTQIAPWEACLRMFIAALVGGAVGFDRELRNKPAGLRTHILISLAAAVFTLITFELHAEVREYEGSLNADPIRIIEAVTAGVAFLAAGAIIQSRGSVKGLTTGANMWLYYTIAALGTVFALIVLIVLARLERGLEARRPDAESEREPPA